MQNSDSSIILDASAFYAGIPFFGSTKCYTTTRVFDEIKHIKKSHSALEALLDAGNIQIKDPLLEFVSAARRLASRSGDMAKMTEADLSVIALALEMKEVNPLIVTDDYAIANVAELSGIRVSYVMTKGISRVGRWVRYCSACSVVYKSGTHCMLCGNKLRSKLTHTRT